ncbi:hypothetical protein [Nocardioides sp. GY 10127]|uniref:hypothetical protein n=1 Tax=Nocardioides sp. GY 10127 TaxID=2569762 RepID=UPI0010A78D12|nr:hypothetical protein [Nocardioides sp. GY 10127]TIC78999.1 hypothetical protein E8D37_18425 [Nocardioides sp. GY 10127]
MGNQQPEEDPDDVHEEIEEPVIVESAHRHGVAEEDMLHALRFAITHVGQDDDMVMFIGPDRAGSLIEVGVVTWHGILAIVHAMSPAREKYLKR